MIAQAGGVGEMGEVCQGYKLSVIRNKIRRSDAYTIVAVVNDTVLYTANFKICSNRRCYMFSPATTKKW